MQLPRFVMTSVVIESFCRWLFGQLHMRLGSLDEVTKFILRKIFRNQIWIRSETTSERGSTHIEKLDYQHEAQYVKVFWKCIIYPCAHPFRWAIHTLWLGAAMGFEKAKKGSARWEVSSFLSPSTVLMSSRHQAHHIGRGSGDGRDDLASD